MSSIPEKETNSCETRIHYATRIIECQAFEAFENPPL